MKGWVMIHTSDLISMHIVINLFSSFKSFPVDIWTFTAKTTTTTPPKQKLPKLRREMSQSPKPITTLPSHSRSKGPKRKSSTTPESAAHIKDCDESKSIALPTP